MMKAISALYLAAPTAAYWSTVGSGCCANMQGIPASTKIFDRPPNGDCLTQCHSMGAGLAVVFPNGKWCTCLHDFAVSQCQPLCANQGCCGSSGVGVVTYMWNSQSAQLSSNVSANVCGGSAAPVVHDCFADGHQECNTCPGNGKTSGGSFPVDCVSTAGNAGCEASPDAPGTAACANDDKGQCCYVLPPHPPAPAPATSGKSCDQPPSAYFSCDPSNSQYDPEDCCLVSCCAGKPVSAATRMGDHIHCECAAQTESLLV